MVLREACPRCGSTHHKKNGHIHNGKQNHRCKACGRQFVLEFEQRRVSAEHRALIERLLRGAIEMAMNPRKKLPPPPKPGHPLCPERVTLDVYLAQLVGFLNGLYYSAAALFEVMPAWLRFLESRGFIDAERRRKTVEELRPLQASLLKMWEKNEDPTLLRATQAWPADAIRLDAYDADAGAGDFYAKCGFREVGKATYREVPLRYFEKLL